jgi:hypothetical protein
MPRATYPKLLIPLAALIIISPLLLHGPSCGHDFGFHLQSWIDAAAQLRHGQYPRWANTPAWNSGEPRFVFYPPISWLFGALLTLLLPMNAAPIAYIFLTLTAAGLTLYRLAREFASPSASLVAATIYIANGYMLFNAFERSAFAELLASAWIPLLLLAVLRARPTIPGIAIPFALLWLTNAPAAVMGSYTFALLAILRVAFNLYNRRRKPYSPIPYPLSPVFLAGAILGLALPAFYLLPAAIERKYVQVAMAIIPNMRYQDNFLFTYTADPGHNSVNRVASYLTVAVLLSTAAALAAAWLLSKKSPGGPFTRSSLRVSGEPQNSTPSTILSPLSLAFAAIALLVLPLSAPIWAHLPEFAFLQFPWRLNTIAAAILAVAIALFLTRLPRPLNLKPWAISLALAIPAAFTLIGYRYFAQGCDVNVHPPVILDFFNHHHGVMPTDEYTPNLADNDLLRTDNPAYWLAPLNAPNTPAPNTVPTPNELHPGANTDDYVAPAEETISTPAPRHLTLHLDQPAILVLHLRDYPNWQVSTGCPTCLFFNVLPHLQRDDGLLAIALPGAGDYTLDIHWRSSLDQKLGITLSILALIILTVLISRKPKPSPLGPQELA